MMLIQILADKFEIDNLTKWGKTTTVITPLKKAREMHDVTDGVMHDAVRIPVCA